MNPHFLFTLTYFVIAVVLARLLPAFNPDTTTLVFFALATFRLGRAVAFNAVFEWLRKPFCKVIGHNSGADDEVVADGTEGTWHFAIGQLLSCPICSGTWAALALVGFYLVSPDIGRLLVYVLGLAGASELLHWKAEYDQWRGTAARYTVGSYKWDSDK